MKNLFKENQWYSSQSCYYKFMNEKLYIYDERQDLLLLSSLSLKTLTEKIDTFIESDNPQIKTEENIIEDKIKALQEIHYQIIEVRAGKIDNEALEEICRARRSISKAIQRLESLK